MRLPNIIHDNKNHPHQNHQNNAKSLSDTTSEDDEDNIGAAEEEITTSSEDNANSSPMAHPRPPSQQPQQKQTIDHVDNNNKQTANKFNNSGHTEEEEEDEDIAAVSGRQKCSHCQTELGRGAAMIIESLHLFYHLSCFRCCVCESSLGNGCVGADVRVRNGKLHCQSCYSNDEGSFSSASRSPISLRHDLLVTF